MRRVTGKYAPNINIGAIWNTQGSIELDGAFTNDTDALPYVIEYRANSGNTSSSLRLDSSLLGPPYSGSRTQVQSWLSSCRVYEDFAAVLDCADEADYALLLTALHTAARRGELFRLRWDDVDFNRKIVRLGTRKRAGGGMEYDWIPMTTTLTSVLAAHKEKTKSELIFSRGGIPYKTRPRLLHRLCGKAGVRRFGYHAIRHLSASLMAQYGMAIPGIQSVLRHKTPLTTSVYLHRLGVVQQDLDRVFSLCGGRHDHENKHAGVQTPSRHTR